MACGALLITMLPLFVVLSCFVFLVFHFRRLLNRSMAREQEWRTALEKLEAVNATNVATIKSLMHVPAE